MWETESQAKKGLCESSLRWFSSRLENTENQGVWGEVIIRQQDGASQNNAAVLALPIYISINLFPFSYISNTAIRTDLDGDSEVRSPNGSLGS